MFRTLITFLLLGCLLPGALSAQVELPDADELFYEDRRPAIAQEQAKKSRILKTDSADQNELDLSAPSLNFQVEQGRVSLDQGFRVAKGDLQMSAKKGFIDQNEKSIALEDEVFVGWSGGNLRANAAQVYFESETGRFDRAELNIDQSDFQIKADEVRKINEFDYIFNQPELTPCRCKDGTTPWSIACKDLKFREEGYAVAKDFKLRVYDTPVFYLPYAYFPVKSKRQSGFLAPEFGVGNRDGFEFSMPYFWDVSETTDIIARPFIATNTRVGSALDYNQVYSAKSKLNSRFYYSNESERDGALRGTIIDDLSDPSFDENRLAGFIQQSWRNSLDGEDVAVPLSIVSDWHYVSDDLILREFDDDELGRYNSRFATSRTVARADFGQLLSADISGEYNQSILTDDDLIFQRAPEVNLYSQKNFRIRPGLKLVAKNRVQSVNFMRERGYEGNRLNINPSVAMPFNIKNYLNGSVGVEGNFTSYSLDQIDSIPEDTSVITDDQRDVYQITGRVGTEIEKVSAVRSDSALAWLTSIGQKNQINRLEKIKHTIEPYVSYNYVPDEEHDNLPLFDSVDRIRQRQLIGTGFKSSIYGKFQSRNTTADEILELSPEVIDIPTVAGIENNRFPGTSDLMPDALPQPIIDRGEIRELASLSVVQLYDQIEAKEDNDPSRDEWSDTAIDFSMYPSDYFALSFDSNVDLQAQDFSSWGVSTHFRDDRNDLLRLRYTFVDDILSQLEANLEFVLTERYKLGYYGRYDSDAAELIDSQLALRISSACNCWDFDIGFRERINPDNKDFIAQLTLKGLGALTQGVSLLDDQELSQ